MLWQVGVVVNSVVELGVVGDVVDHRGISIVTGSTEEKRGEKQ